MDKYGLRQVGLVVQQGFSQDEADVNELKSLLMQDLYKNSEELLRTQTAQIDSLRRSLQAYEEENQVAASLVPEMKVLFPHVEKVSCSPSLIVNTSNGRPDTVTMAYLKCAKKINDAEREKIQQWLSARIKSDNIKLLIE